MISPIILSIEMMSQYLPTVIMPQMIEKEEKEGNLNEEENKLQAALNKYRLTVLCLGTIYKWIKKLGFNYEPRRKSYYVDGYEKESTIHYQWQFIERYLAYEQLMYQWIHITEKDALTLIEKGLLPKNSGYHYRDNNTDVPMVEYHVDTHEMFQRQLNEGTEYRRKRSVRYKEGKMPFIFGHDEAIFKQYLFPKKFGLVQMERLQSSPKIKEWG
jgi:hypothetical protein